MMVTSCVILKSVRRVEPPARSLQALNSSLGGRDVNWAGIFHFS